MKIRRGFLCVQHGDAFGQKGVYTAHPCRERAAGIAVEMHDLGGGVHARVSASGGGYGNGLAGNLRERAFQRRLYGGDAGGLLLPAEERAAVVGQGEGVSGHDVWETGFRQPETDKSS